jgi:hypothetical protein
MLLMMDAKEVNSDSNEVKSEICESEITEERISNLSSHFARSSSINGSKKARSSFTVKTYDYSSLIQFYPIIFY